MADIKRFTGFIAPDGSTHASLTAATIYTNDLKVKAALADFTLLTPESSKGLCHDDYGQVVILIKDLPEFLAGHKDDILAAFGQKATLRAPRGTKVKKAAVVGKVTASIATEPAVIPTVAAQMKADGLVDVEE